MPNACAIASCCSPMAACAAPALSQSCVPASVCPTPAWRIFFLRSPDPIMRAPLAPLLAKELWEILGGRALWLLLLLVCPLVGYSFVQAVSLYGEASAPRPQSPVLTLSLTPPPVPPPTPFSP